MIEIHQFEETMEAGRAVLQVEFCEECSEENLDYLKTPHNRNMFFKCILCGHIFELTKDYQFRGEEDKND